MNKATWLTSRAEQIYKKEFNQAEQDLREAIKIAPTYFEAYLLLSLIYRETAAYEEAIRVLDEAPTTVEHFGIEDEVLTLINQIRVCWGFVSTYSLLGEYDKASKYAHAGLDTLSNSTEANLERARRQMDLDAAEEAFKTFI